MFLVLFQLNVDWFLSAEASLKRSFIRKLIYELLKESSHEETPGAYGSNHHPVETEDNGIDQEPAKFISEQCKSAHAGSDNSACFRTEIF